jgi:AcrR family transcriptional regulator
MSAVESQPPSAPQRLPSGRHGLSREAVLRSQRERILDAMAQACASKGYGGATVAGVIARAGVSRMTFYEQFRDREDCFLAAYDAILARFLADVIAAYQQPELEWPQRVRAAVQALLSFLAAEPAYARMCVIEVLAAGERAYERYTWAVRALASLLEEGSGQRSNPEELPESMGEAVIEGGAFLVREQILAGRTEQLEALLPSLTYAALVPYLGQDEALAVAEGG